MLSETITRALLLSLISFTCEPFLPMIIDASCVTMRHLMWMWAEGGEVVDALESSASGSMGRSA